MSKPERIYYHNGIRLDPHLASYRGEIQYIDAMDDEETRCVQCYGHGEHPTKLRPGVRYKDQTLTETCEVCEGSGKKPDAHLIIELRNQRDDARAHSTQSKERI